jgi:hypothetical protein
MTELSKYTDVEMELLREVEAGEKKSLSEVFPDNLLPELVVKWSRAAGSLVDKKDGELAISLHVAGRFHHLARINPEVLEYAGVKTMAEYEDQILKCKQHRSTVYKYSSAYLAFPTLTPEGAAAIGTENLSRATRVAKSSGASDSQKQELLEKAKTSSVQGFKDHVEKGSGLSAPGETTDIIFKCSGTIAEVRHVESFLSDPDFVAWAGTARDIGKIIAALEASTTEWKREEVVQVGREVDMTGPEAAQDEW